MNRARVFTKLPEYAAAAAELPVSAALAGDRRGAVVVVPGSGDWWNVMLAARAGGAAAVVLAQPSVLRREDVGAFPWPGDIPVVVERPRLRPDVVADALRARRGLPPRLVTVECAAPAGALDSVILDGLGWARFLAGGSLTFRAGLAAAHGRMALLDSVAPAGSGGGSVSATLAGTPIGGRHSGGLLQVLALGEVRSEITVDQPAGLTRVETCTEEGVLRAPERYESSARLALRRALEACSSSAPVPDLDELAEDHALARALLEA
ncbi:hypothetical protein Asphe3_01840 [Pseudarthrobacter phenanthrenivorans Sphe3]|uniref:Uncharacterized protein n=1 Tax=Pseudarthrobacter phenanthrenivorans (strain DSM 18606 / JCM 16027 / LMG 23796 / Sphe3) TaxID=930171 RepID=F0M6D1_PSEPM|nr:hypothetical protein Asphe3_01840 [Pseudarthrobacter phenanthrenivorans Sphe3]